jgi:hypothetical protein
MDQHDLLLRLVGCLEELGVRYFVTGSVASMAYGEPRLTNDIDVVADLRGEHVPGLVAHFPFPEFYLSEDAARTAILRRRQFNIIHPASGLKIDVIIPNDDEFDESRFSRVRRMKAAQDAEAAFASPEDVILKKLLYHREGGSDKHLRDIAGILKISGKELDTKYLERWTVALGVADTWKQLSG